MNFSTANQRKVLQTHDFVVSYSKMAITGGKSKWACHIKSCLNCSMAGLSSSSITKLAKDEYVSMEVLVKVCTALGVDIGDIMEVISSREKQILVYR